MPAPFTPSPSIGASDPPLLDGPASNAATARELLNNRRHLRGATWGALTWSGRLVVGGSATAPSITVGAIEAVTLRDSTGVWRPYFTDAETPLGIGDVEGAPASLTADTWHYVYAHDSAGSGSPHFQVSTTAPGTSLAWKNAGGTALYRYLGCFPTDGSGNPLALRAVRGRYLYNEPDDIVPGGATANISTYSTANLASRVPPHSRHALVRARVTRTASGANILMAYGLRTPGATNPSFAPVLVKVPSLSDFDVRQAEVLLSSSRTLEYATTAADCALDLAVAGFQE